MTLKRWIAAGALTLLAVQGQAQAQAPAAAPAAASPAPVLSPAYAQDLRDVLDALQIYEWIRVPPKDSASLSPPERAFLAVFRQQVTRDETHRRFSPVLATVLDPRQAADIARLTRSPAFRKREAYASRADATQANLQTMLTHGEKAELMRIDATPAMKAFRNAKPKLTPAFDKASRDWVEQFDQAQSLKLMEVLAKTEADLAAARASGDAKTILIGKVGVPYLDQFAYVAGSSLIEMSNSWMQFEDELKAMGFATVLQPENLGSAAHIARGNRIVDQAETAINQVLKSVDQTISERNEKMRQIQFPGKGTYLKTLESATGSAFTFTLDTGEVFRRILDLHRRVLAFVSERQAAIVIENGKLLFRNDKDLATFQELAANLEAAEADTRAVIERQRDKEEDVRQKALKGINTANAGR